MNPITVDVQPQSYREAVAVDTKGKLQSHDIILFKEPTAGDYSADKFMWDSCCKEIFKKFEETGKSDSIAISCPESHRLDNDDIDVAVADEVINSAISYATNNLDVEITFIAKDSRILNIYEKVLTDIQDIYDAGTMKRINVVEGQIGRANSDVIAITTEDLPGVQKASETYIKNAEEQKLKNEQYEHRPKRDTTLQEPKEQESSLKEKVTSWLEPEKPIVGSDISDDDL